MMITYEYVKRYDGKFNVWRKGTGPWLLVKVFNTESEAQEFCSDMRQKT